MGLILLWGEFLQKRGLELTWVLTPFVQNSTGWEYKLRSSLCTHAFHRTDSKFEILTFMSQMGECQHQIHTQHAQSMKTECDYLNGWIKKAVIYAKISPKTVNSRDIAGECRRKGSPLALESQELNLWFLFPIHFILGFSALSCSSFPLFFRLVGPERRFFPNFQRAVGVYNRHMLMCVSPSLQIFPPPPVKVFKH